MHYGISTPGTLIVRDDVRDEAAHSQVDFTAVQNETNLGMAAQAHETLTLSPWQTTEFADKLERMFLRMTVCPADYNHNGTVQGPLIFQTAFALGC